jgi:hypothetical protein
VAIEAIANDASAITINAKVAGVIPAGDVPPSVGSVSLAGRVPAALALAVASTATTAWSALPPSAGSAADPTAKTE